MTGCAKKTIQWVHIAYSFHFLLVVSVDLWGVYEGSGTVNLLLYTLKLTPWGARHWNAFSENRVVWYVCNGDPEAFCGKITTPVVTDFISVMQCQNYIVRKELTKHRRHVCALWGLGWLLPWWLWVLTLRKKHSTDGPCVWQRTDWRWGWKQGGRTWICL